MVILDLQLPDAAGFDALASLRGKEKTRTIPVVVLSGADLTAEQMESLSTQAQAILHKEKLTEHDLLESIARSLKLYEHKGVPGTSPLSLEERKSTSPLPDGKRRSTSPLPAEQKGPAAPVPAESQNPPTPRTNESPT
jgi:DNA-binding NarL/FixJ family response regulator